MTLPRAKVIAGRYALAPACISVAVLLHVSPVGPLFHPTGPFILAVLVAAWFGGVGPGVFAAFLSAISLPQLIAIAELSSTGYPLLAGFFDLPRFITLGLTGAAVGWGTSSYRRTEAARRERERELNRVRDQLETAVAERTAHLAASEERYARAMEATEAGHWEWDLVTHQVFHSPRFRELYGIPVDEKFVDRDAWKARQPISPSERARQEQALQAAIADPSKSYDIELSFEVRPGEVRWLRSRGKVFRDENGRPLRISGATTDITPQKLAQEALRLSEERYALAMRASGEGHWDWKIATDEFYASPRYLEIGGLLSDMQYSRRADIVDRIPFYPEDRADYEATVAAHFAGETPRMDIVIRIVPNGELRWLHVIGMCSRDDDGKPVRWAGSVNDITARKLAEEALRESRERYALAVAGSDDGVWDVDFAARRVFLSARARELAGLPPGAEMVPLDEFLAMLPLHPEDMPRRGEAMHAHLAGLTPAYDGEFRLRQLDGVYRWRHIHGLCVRDANGKPARMAGSFSDVDARRRAEDALRLSEERYALALEASEEGHFDNDLEAGEIFVSARVNEIYGFPRQAGISNRIDFLNKIPLHPDDRSRVLAELSRPDWENPAGDLHELECRIVPRPGETRWIHSRAKVVRDAEGRPRRRVGVVADITERKLAEDALRASEQRYRLAMEAAQDSHWDWNMVTGEYYLSPNSEQFWGFAAGTTIAARDSKRGWRHFFTAAGWLPEDREAWMHATAELFAGTGDRVGMVVRAKVRGEIRSVQLRGVCIRNAAGKPIRFSGSARDVTESKRAEAALRLSEERYALAMEASEEGHFDWNVQTDEIFASAHLKKVLGLPAGTAHSTRTAMVTQMPFYPGDFEHVAAMAREVLAGSTLQHAFEYRILPAGAQEPRWIHARWKIFRDTHGVAQRVIGVVADVTDKKRVEDELRSRQEMLELAQKSARAIAFEWKIGAGEGENRWSSDLEAMYGFAPGTYDGSFETWKKVVHPDDWPAVKEAINHAVRTGEVASEYRVVHPDLSVHWLQAKGRMLFDAAGQPARMVGFMQDITQRKQAEEELHKMEQELRRAQRLEAMGTLAGGIAHDFNNILGAILGYGEMAMRNARSGTRLHRDLDSIMAAGERGRSLVDRILAFSRSGVGERMPVHVEEVVREALDQLAAKLPENVTIAPRLHAGRAAMLGDSTQVHQVVMNLANNAVQAMPHGGVLRVRLETVRLDASRSATVGVVAPGEYIVLRVSDSGTGIAPDIFERMFDPFFTTKEVGVGSGLGLSLVHGIVANVGGAIDVATELARGSTFTVYLPRSGDAPAKSVDENRPLPRGEGERVLVVDDEESLVRLATETLERLGYTPVGFTSSAAALAAFRADPARFDAVLTDERMPGLSGSALIREMRGIRDTIPVVLMSGYLGATPRDARETGVAGALGILPRMPIGVGADVVVKKPLSARDLAASMARALGH